MRSARWAGIRRVNRWRLVAPLVLPLQLASVTWVPVVHPCLHGRLSARPPAEWAVTPPSAGAHGLVSADVCWACQASLGAPGPDHGGQVQECRIRNRTAPWPPDAAHPLPPFDPAHRVRAPPRA